MAKNLNFIVGKNSFEAGITKVEREKVYGYVEEVVLDRNGNVSSSGNLLDDGQTLILSGETALKIVNEKNEEIDKKSLKTVYMDGKDAVLVPSSYDTPIQLNEASMDDLFNLEVSTIYQLNFEDSSSKESFLKLLSGDKVYRFVFNYRADYEGADAIILTAQNQVFILTGRILEFEYLENKTITSVVEIQDELQEDEEMDFGML
jgi:hypothetical protein